MSFVEKNAGNKFYLPEYAHVTEDMVDEYIAEVVNEKEINEDKYVKARYDL